MHYRCWLLVALLGSLAVACPGDGAAAETPAVPLLGVVSKGRVFTVVSPSGRERPRGYTARMDLVQQSEDG